MDRSDESLYIWRMQAVALIDQLAARPLRITMPPRFYRCEPAWSWAPPPLPDFDLWFVLDGRGRLTTDGRSWAITPQTCFLLRPGTRISARQNPRHRLRVFAVHFEFTGAFAAGLPPQVQRLRDGVFFSALARQCEVAWRMGDPRRATSLVAEMLLHLYAEPEIPAGSPADRRVAAMLDQVREEPGRFWSVSELARQAGLSRAQLRRRLKHLTGFAPETYLILARIDRAKQLLRETELSIGAVADALGYRDVYYFSRQFAQIAGTPASAFRRVGQTRHPHASR